MSEALKEEVMSVESYLDYIYKYADDIYVRELVNGRWGSYSLSELTFKQAFKHIKGWFAERILPTRVRREDEE